MLLDHLGEREAAARIRAALGDCFRKRDRLTADLNRESPASTRDFTRAILERL